MIKIENINKFYAKNHVLKDLSLDIPDGEVVLVSGPNGSGKTTMIKLILGIVYPQKGIIRFNGDDISGSYDYRSKIGYMPQYPNYPENLTGSEILKICKDLRQNGLSKNMKSNNLSQIDAKSDKMASEDFSEIIDKLDLTLHFRKPFKSLSGGNKQKINVLQAFAFNPDCYILDEPSVSLDPSARIVLKNLIREKKQEGKTVIIVTHIISEMIDITDRFIYLMDGKLIFNGSVDELISKSENGDIDTAITRISERHEG